MKVKHATATVISAVVFCLGTYSVFAAGYPYPDGSVSPFAPAFFGIGICGGSIASEVNGVAAVGGDFLGAVGDCQNQSNARNQTTAVLFTKTRGLEQLPQSDPSAATTAYAISGDGKIKAGNSGVACYWDENNQYHALPSTYPGAFNSAHAVSRDGSVIGGDLPEVSTKPDNPPTSDGGLWATGGTGYTRLERPPTYDRAVVLGLSKDGQLSCGTVVRDKTKDGSAPGSNSAFVQKTGGAIQLLSGSSPTDAVSATGVTYYGDLSAGEIFVVGSAGNDAVYWNAGSKYVLPKLRPGAITTATALDDVGRFIVGSSLDPDTAEFSAIFWDYSDLRGAIAGALQNTYKLTIGKWKLATASSISGDGYTIGGQGINPDDKEEGWVAVLPPILHPPLVNKPPPQHANPGEAFALPLTLKNPYQSTSYTYSAKGLPPGFRINEFGAIVGTWSPDKAQSGTYTVTVTVTNEQGSGSTTFSLTLPAQNVFDSLLQGHSYLPQSKAPGDTAYYASFGQGISLDGLTAVGTDGLASDSRAYAWDPNNGISGLPMLDGAVRTYSSALAASADGKTIVGQAASPVDADGKDHSVAVVWKTSVTAKAMRTGPTHYAEGAIGSQLSAINIGLFPQGTSSIANAVSGDGSVVVGFGGHKIDGVSYQVYQAFRWTATGGMVGLGWLDGGQVNHGTLRSSMAYGISADGSTIVGVSSSTSGTQAMRYTAAGGMQGLGLAPGATYSRAAAASSDGSVIVGFNSFGDGSEHAFRWTATSGMVDLGVLPGDASTEASAVSADGSVIVGQSVAGFNQQRPFIWDQQNGMRDLKSVLVANNPALANWTLTAANGLSADGRTVVGVGRNPNGDREGFTAGLKVQPPQPLNISTRMRVLSGDDALIGGFIVTGGDAKKVIIRGIGPSLAAAGLQNVLADPLLDLHQDSTTLATNDNWKEHQAEVAATGIAPPDDLEAAIVSTLSPGAYTVILRDKSNQPGVGLVEVYDLGSSSKLANISTRGFVDTGDNVMIGGFIVGGGSPIGVTRVVVRGLGPSLATAGVSHALADPMLELYDNNGLTVAANNNWKDSQQADLVATGIQPTNDVESAIIETLAPGAYTAIVRGNDGSTGVGLVEVYNLQN